MKLILTIPNEQDEQFVRELLERLQMELTITEAPPSQVAEATKLKEWLEAHRVAGEGVLVRIPDPVKWQRDMRRDRKLPSRT